MLRTTFWTTAVSCALASVAAVLAQAPVAQARVDVQPVVSRYCLSCHSDRLKTGGLTLENLDYAHPAADAAWNRSGWRTSAITAA